VQDPTAFILAVLAILATPGPTNTLLATSGVVAGFRKSLPLIAAELAGYLISINVLALLIGPLVQGSPLISHALRLACGVYLAWVAWLLWKEGAAALKSDQPIHFRRVFITTLLNPKAIIFAFVIIPFLQEGRVIRALPYLAGFAGMVVMVAVGWISAGAMLQTATERRNLARRVGAVVIGTFAVAISASAFKG
jgi:threonine/homoserine/homoserine lactone efflux protein